MNRQPDLSEVNVPLLALGEDLVMAENVAPRYYSSKKVGRIT